jgi:hypothetical protein
METSADIKALGERISKLEGKIMLATGAGLVLAAWLGVTTFYTIPTAARDVLKNTAAQAAENDIAALLAKAKADGNAIAQLSAGGTITIAGVCFKPRSLIRCYGHNEHMTWVDNQGECTGAGYGVEGELQVLAKCS